MQKYIDYLVQDLKKAAQNLPSPPFLDLDEDNEHMRGVIEYENTQEKPMQEWFNISKESFPPGNKLNKKQIKLLVKEILELWKAFNFDPVLPKNLPPVLTYNILVNSFDQPVIWISHGMVAIEFCNYDTNNCPFPEEYCMCTNLNDEEYEEEPIDNSQEIRLLLDEINEFLEQNGKVFTPNKEIQKYVDQLISDLELKTCETYERPVFSGSINISSVKDHKEMQEKPYVSLEELSGIKKEAFPDITHLDGIQIKKLLIAILEFFDAFRLIIYHPENVPPEIKYDAITSKWNHIWVKDLPLSGDFIDLCTGDQDTCPYSDYCDCDYETDVDSYEEEILGKLPFDHNDDDNEKEEDNDLPF